MWTFSCVAVAGVEVEVAMLYIDWSVIGQQPGIDSVSVVAVVEASSPLPWLCRNEILALTQDQEAVIRQARQEEDE